MSAAAKNKAAATPEEDATAVEQAPWKAEDQDMFQVDTDAVPENALATTSTSSALANIPTDEEVAVNPAGNGIFSDQVKFRMDEIFVPQLRVANGLTQEVQSGDAKPGDWLMMGYAPEKAVEIVIISMARVRELRDDETRAIQCKSQDQIMGEGEYGPGSPLNPSGACTGCPMANWIPQGPGKKSKPAPCTEIYRYQAYSLTHGSMCMIDFKRTGMNEAKKINMQLAGKGFKGSVIVLKSVSQQGTRGSYFIPFVTSREITGQERGTVESAIF